MKRTLFELLKSKLFEDVIKTMGDKNQDELLNQLITEYSDNLPKFSFNNLTIHIPELIKYALALGIRFGIDFKDFEMAIKKIQEEMNKSKYESFYT